jgi:hypothetical protein
MVLMENAKCTLFSGSRWLGMPGTLQRCARYLRSWGVLIKEEEEKTLSQWVQELETRSRRPPVLPWRDQARPAASDSSASDQSTDGNVLSSIVIDSLDANVSWDSVCPSENLI